MPTYGYRCEKCGHEFDVWQRMADEPGAACPSCGGAGKRLFFPAGIVFKGSGFYKTDSRTASGDGASTSPSPTTPPSPAKTSKNSDSAPTSSPSSSAPAAAAAD